MVRELTAKELKNFRYYTSDDTVVEDVRTEGSTLAAKGKKPPLMPDAEDVAWWENDVRTPPVELEPYMADILVEPKILGTYSYPTLHWAKAFYKYIAEPLTQHVDNVGMYDLLLFYSNLYPFPAITVMPFYQAIEELFSLKVKTMRYTIARHIIENDQATLVKLSRWEIVDWRYTSVMTYQTLRRLVLDEFSKTPAYKAMAKTLKLPDKKETLK